MALGIDSVAHTTCLNTNGKTIAVLGCGFNNIFPQKNIPLFNRILAEGGLIVSEYSPNTVAQAKYFPERNRIISGLSIGILVIEAAFRSGTSITANYAFAQKKDVFCIPSSLDSNKGVGTARLIEKGAKIVLTPEKILKNYNLKDGKTNNTETHLNKRKLPPVYAKTYQCVGIHGDHLNNIARNAEKSIQEVSQELFILELEGYIERMPGGYYVPTT